MDAAFGIEVPDVHVFLVVEYDLAWREVSGAFQVDSESVFSKARVFELFWRGLLMAH